MCPVSTSVLITFIKMWFYGKHFVIKSKCKVTANISFIVVGKDNCSGRLTVWNVVWTKGIMGVFVVFSSFSELIFSLYCFLDHINAILILKMLFKFFVLRTTATDKCLRREFDVMGSYFSKTLTFIGYIPLLSVFVHAILYVYLFFHKYENLNTFSCSICVELHILKFLAFFHFGKSWVLNIPKNFPPSFKLI